MEEPHPVVTQPGGIPRSPAGQTPRRCARVPTVAGTPVGAAARGPHGLRGGGPAGGGGGRGPPGSRGNAQAGKGPGVPADKPARDATGASSSARARVVAAGPRPPRATAAVPQEVAPRTGTAAKKKAPA